MESASLLRSLPLDGNALPASEDRRPRPDDRELTALLSARTAAGDGCHEAPYPGLHYYRVSHPVAFHKTLAFGPTLTVVAQGTKRAELGEQTFDYDPSRYLLITGEVSFAGRVIDASPERPYLAVCLAIPGDAVAKTLLALADEGNGEGNGDRAGDADGDQVPPAFVSAVDAQVRDTVVRLVRAVDDPLERRIVAPMIVEELVFRLLRSDAAAAVRSAVPRGPDAASIARAIHFIRANPRRPLSVEEVARHVAMSPSHFAHRFRAVARVSPMRYVKQIRLDEARRLMLAGGLRANEAAAGVGYESASHFARDFKAIFGATPAAYARRSLHHPLPTPPQAVRKAVRKADRRNRR
jgi:AraC-like DNA-binding protein